MLLEDVKILARLEAYSLARSDADLSPGTRIASDTCLAGLDGKNAKATQFDAFAFDETLFHRLEDGVDRGFRLGSNESSAFDDTLNEILLDQVLPHFLKRER